MSDLDQNSLELKRHRLGCFTTDFSIFFSKIELNGEAIHVVNETILELNLCLVTIIKRNSFPFYAKME